MQRIRTWSSIALAATLAGAAPLALAQANPAHPDHPESGAVTHTPPFRTPPPTEQSEPGNPAQATMPPRIPQTDGVQTGQVMGQHDMTGTVKSVSQEGIVEVQTGLGLLKVHFPRASQNLRKGEKITLHLSYTVVEAPASASTQ